METVPHIEALLAHADWVRALARSLVADPAHAEDVAQEAWLAALRSPPAGRLQSARLARGRRAQRGAQARSRRSARERSASSPPRAARRCPSAAELVEAAAQQRELADLVLELDEPYRRDRAAAASTTDWRSPRSPRGPASPRRPCVSRLQRALERLREKLDRRHGDRETWCAALVPLGRARAAGEVRRRAGQPSRARARPGASCEKPVLGAVLVAASRGVRAAVPGPRVGTGPASPRCPTVDPLPVPVRAGRARTRSLARAGGARRRSRRPRPSGMAGSAARASGVVEGRCVDADGQCARGRRARLDRSGGGAHRGREPSGSATGDSKSPGRCAHRCLRCRSFSMRSSPIWVIDPARARRCWASDPEAADRHRRRTGRSPWRVAGTEGTL
jgi:DNA-directed RNA polymerase specialized sigma24 family protein